MARRKSKEESNGVLLNPEDINPSRVNYIEPGRTGGESGYQISMARTNRSGVGPDNTYQDTINGELYNITKGVSPIEGDLNAISVETAIALCQKAYWNVPIFRNTIDIQTEFSNSKLHFKGVNKNTTKFYQLWYEKINGPKVADMFFREWFRSGNVFIYKFNGTLQLQEYRKMSRAAENSVINVTKEIPLRYIILNPRDMRCNGAASFVDAKYSKVLNSFEVARLKNPKTQEEIDFVNTLTPQAVQEIQKGMSPVIQLSSENLISIFCGKQDYEALAVPMYYAVLPDIDLKLEFKKAEKVIARTVDYAILLITAGSKEREEGGDTKLNAQLVTSLKTLFDSESVGRVLVSDFTTKGEFIIPDLNKIFGSEKYKVVNEDIANGLMNIFWGEEKFANSMVKIKVFLERLNSARDAFLNHFLKPEMERIADIMNFQNIPNPEFEQIDLRDEVEYLKLYNRMAEVGILTAEELFTAYETHKLPLKENSIEAQKEYKSLRDKGLYQPLLGGAKDAAENGRPGGTKAPQKTKKVSPIGASLDVGASEELYSMANIRETAVKCNDLSFAVEAKYKEFHGVQRLSKKHKDVAWFVTQAVIYNEPAEKWEDTIKDYISNPEKNTTQFDEIADIAAEHNVDMTVAALMFHSKKI